MKKISKSYLLIIAIVVSMWIIMEVIFYQIACDAEREYEKDLINQAKFYNEDMQNTRNWNLKLGGIYAHEDKIELNLYMDDNFVNTDKGRFVRINPGWMTRMLSQGFKQDRLLYSVVSNDPINPVNRAKGFYKKALHKLAQTNSDEALYEIDRYNKRLHYVKPIYTTQSCLECHMENNYKLGDLRGGMVVDMDASFTLGRTDKAWQSFYYVSLFATLFIGLLLYFILNISRQKFHYLQKTILLEKTLKQKIKKLNQVLKASELGYWEWDIQKDEYIIDVQCLKILGLKENGMDEIVLDWKSMVDPDDLRKIMPIIENAIQTKSSYVVDFRMRHTDGHYVWIEAAGGVTSFDEFGKVTKLSGVHQEITKRKLLEIEKASNEGYLNTLFEKNPNIIIVTNGTQIIKVNDAFFRFFDEYDSLESFTQEHSCISEFFQNSESDDFVTPASNDWTADVLESSERVVKMLYKEEEYYFAVHAKKVYENGLINIIVTFNDITETYGLKKRFEELSIRDELTKLYNRRYFNKIFKDEVNRAMREKHSFCFAIMDIDNFKLYNDNYGHDEGDMVLARFADKMCELTKRSNEFFFRLGGEEFGLIFSNRTKEEAISYVESICEATEALNIEHLENLPSKKFTISIGFVYVGVNDEFDLKLIYKHADQALYLAKEKGRNSVKIFE
jgi:diguanylate cyclase (GGDEF)-like protein